eukprot:3376590-Prymnesium_polylepis.1
MSALRVVLCSPVEPRFGCKLATQGVHCTSVGLPAKVLWSTRSALDHAYGSCAARLRIGSRSKRVAAQPHAQPQHSPHLPASPPPRLPVSMLPSPPFLPSAEPQPSPFPAAPSPFASHRPPMTADAAAAPRATRSDSRAWAASARREHVIITVTSRYTDDDRRRRLLAAGGGRRALTTPSRGGGRAGLRATLTTPSRGGGRAGLHVTLPLPPPFPLPRYVTVAPAVTALRAVTPTVTPTGNRSDGMCCALVSSGTPDRRLAARARYDHRYAPLPRPPLRPHVTLTRRARSATESRTLRYRPLAGDATYVTRTTSD